MVAKSRGDHQHKTARAPVRGWSCPRINRKPSALAQHLIELRALAQRLIELCWKRATDNPMDMTPDVTNDPHYWSTPEVVNWLEGLAWMPKQGTEYITALDGDGEFLTTRVEAAHYEEVLRSRLWHLESCDVEAVLPKKDFGLEKAGHSLQFVLALVPANCERYVEKAGHSLQFVLA